MRGGAGAAPCPPPARPFLFLFSIVGPAQPPCSPAPRALTTPPLSPPHQAAGKALSIAPQAEDGAALVAPLAPALVAKALLDHRDKVRRERARKDGGKNVAAAARAPSAAPSAWARHGGR